MGSHKLSVKGIMFDLDGTILDTRPAYIEAAKIACEATGQKLLVDSVALEIPKRMEQRQTLATIVSGDPNAFLQAYRKAFYKVSVFRTKPMPNVVATLDELASKAKLAVITMRFMPGEDVRLELKKFHLDGYFAHVVTALDTAKPKPSPEALIKAVAQMDVEMCKCVIVGDSTVDVKAGKAAGSKTVAVLSGLYGREELAEVKPDFIINNVAELPEIVA
ncbi:MAG TPA: HAD family hydrolase [Candidatus Acidoferrales bacterium]|nr:HAD family hydrolase [Candidatus Acidoferrales bacterium]